MGKSKPTRKQYPSSSTLGKLSRGKMVQLSKRTKRSTKRDKFISKLNIADARKTIGSFETVSLLDSLTTREDFMDTKIVDPATSNVLNRHKLGDGNLKYRIRVSHNGLNKRTRGKVEQHDKVQINHILSHPYFQSDPFAAINSHIINVLNTDNSYQHE